MYSMVIQPVITYGALAWHQSQSHHDLNQSSTGALAPFQNQCLCVIMRAYQAALISTLEAEIYVPSLNLHLDFLMAWATQCLEDSGMAAKIEEACQEVCCYLWAHSQNQQRHFTQYIHPQPLPQGQQLEWTQDSQTA